MDRGTEKHLKDHLIGIKVKVQLVILNINKENNDFDNLWESTNSKHRIAHDSMNNLVAELINLGIIEFDREQGIYYLIK